MHRDCSTKQSLNTRDWARLSKRIPAAHMPRSLIYGLFIVTFKLYETYAKAALKDARYRDYAGKTFNAAMQAVKKLDENPPSRQTNEYSLYKLIRALMRVQYASNMSRLEINSKRTIFTGNPFSR